MNKYDITVLYSCHRSSANAAPDSSGQTASTGTAPDSFGQTASTGTAPDSSGQTASTGTAPDSSGQTASTGTAPDFPPQTLDRSRIQVLTAQEDDSCYPHKNALARISEAAGTYTILLNAEDTFDSSFLERMISRMEQSDCSFVMPELMFRPLGTLPIFFTVQKSEVCTVDTNRHVPILPVGLHGLLIPTKELQNALSRAEYPVETEKQILLYLLHGNPVFEYLGTCSVEYETPQEYDHQYHPRSLSANWYYPPLEQFLLPYLEREQPHGIDCYARQLALYMLHIRLHANRDNRNRHVLEPEEVPAYLALFSRVLQYVEVSDILASDLSTTYDNERIRLLDLRLKKNDCTYFPEISCGKEVWLMSGGHRFCPLSKIQVKIKLIDYRNGKLEIDGSFMDLFSEKTSSICAKFDGKLYPLTYTNIYSLKKFFGVSFYRMKTFHVSIPVPAASHERLLNFVFCADGREYQMEYGFPSHTSRFARDFTYGYWQFGEYLSFWNAKGIHVLKSNPLLVLKKEFLLWLQMWKRKGGVFREQIPLKILNFVLRPYFKRQTIWMFLDKIYKGGDSSEYIYRYADKQNDNIKKYYLLDKNCPDYARMKKEGYRPLVRGSLKHRLIFLNANMVIASNSTVFAFNDYTFERSLPIRGVTHFDVACVQHGMSIQKIAIAQQRLRDNTRLYFCASKYEIENLSKPVYGYEGYDALKLTGVPRYDGLKDRAEKILLISPTWRMNSALPVSKNEGVSRDYNPNFKETDYYKVYNSLINDPRLLESAKAYGYRIHYVLHPIVSPQAEDFTKNDLVKIIPSTGDMSYEKIFCESALMVTDFSGVQFDFAYMRKPVVYLHHKDIPQHYEEGTFHYTTMGFGEICHTNDELIDVLCGYMKNGCAMPEQYRRRADDFFAFSDDKNCERIYPVMLEYERNRKR